LKCGSATLRPDEKMGYAACENAFLQQKWESGCKGAGTGAIVGNMCGNNRAMKGFSTVDDHSIGGCLNICTHF
jgi:L-aminopeptidase/D-esterase-like protein